MMDTKKCRTRGPNFSISESSLLCDVLNDYKHIIENKKTDGANLLQKQKAWLEVGEKFNALTTGHFRSVDSLQQNLKNLKKKAKKDASSAKMDIPVDRTALIQSLEEFGTSSDGWEKVADSTGASREFCQTMFITMKKEADKETNFKKKNIMGTGGGPPLKSDDDPLLDKVKGLVGPSIDGLYTIYDGDTTLMELQNIPPLETQYGKTPDETPSQATSHSIIETPRKNELEEAYFINDRANLKRKPHDLLSRKRKLDHLPEKQSVSEKFKVLASEKMNLLEMQKELLTLQLQKEKEGLEHQRLLWSMEVEDAKARYAHNAELRKLELEKFK